MTHIVLDLDETLVYTVQSIINVPETLHSDCYRIFSNYVTVIRPYTREFLLFCFEYFESVSIFSAATQDYVDCMEDFLLKYINAKSKGYNFLFSYSYKRCSKKLRDMVNEFYATYDVQKPLCKMWKRSIAKKIGMNKFNTVIIDDRHDYCLPNYSNAIYIVPFNIYRKDIYLLYMIDYLFHFILPCKNIRSLDKRNWIMDIQRISLHNIS